MSKMTGGGKRPLLVLVALVANILLFVPQSPAEEYTQLKMYPEHVGVFVATGTQQFVAFGVKNNGEQVNITDQVTWSSSDDKLVSIDKNGLAKVLPGITSGQVKISCLLPTSTLAASTSLTIVNIAGATFNGRQTEVNVTQWPGSWPSVPGQAGQASKISLLQENKDKRAWYEVYLYDVAIGTYTQQWKTIPYATPWEGFSGAGGLNSMIANVFSYDGGKSFWVHSWDYLASDSHLKSGPGGLWDDCWVGLMIHSFCDFVPADCNGRYRTNLFFASVDNDKNCWGAQVMKK